MSLLLAWLSYSALAAADLSPESFAAVQSVTIDVGPQPSFVLAKVLLANKGSQLITAYSVTVTARYADGTEVVRETTTDAVFALSYDRLGTPPPPGSRFDPGEFASVTVALPSDKSGPLPTAVAKVRMVALADRTAYGPTKDVEALASSRQEEAGLFADLASDAATIGAAPDPQQRLGTTVASLRDAAGHGGKLKPRMMHRIEMLTTTFAWLGADTTKIERVRATYHARSETLREHSELIQHETGGK